MDFTHENIVLNIFEDDFQPFIATEEKLAQGESSFLEFQTPASPSTYLSSNFSFSSPPSPFSSPTSTSGELETRTRKAEEDFYNIKKVKRSLFSEESTDF